ncbi:NAD(P)-dependent oxidoreductase [Streptomyces sp. UMAF16]|nr:NAD(P)-dependent oxidoreductase [Streptomyces sp. UMAF16]
MHRRVAVGDDHALGTILEGVARRLAAHGVEVVRIPARPAPALTHYAPSGDIDIVVISSRTVLSRSALRSATRLRGVVFPSIGTGSCDSDAATALGILIANGATRENVHSMAEANVLLMLALLYELPRKQARFEQRWTGAAPVTSRTLRGRTVGFVGFGRISQRMTRLLAPWELGPVLAHTRSPDPAAWPGVRFTSVEEVLRGSELVVVNLPYSPHTRGMLGRDRLALLRPGAFLVNAARGGIVDEDALAELLSSGRIGGAAVDTFAVEPPPPDSALRAAPNVILTNHVIGHTVEMFDSFTDTAVQSVLALLAGRPPEHVVNPACLPRWSERLAATGPAGGEPPVRSTP